MIIRHQQLVFPWAELQDSPSLAVIRRLLEVIPDENLLRGLRAARGKGRDDYPVSALWGTLLLTIALRHPSIEACLAELRRNAALRRLVGIDAEERVPRAWNLSRFLEVLGDRPHRQELMAVFNRLVSRLGKAIDTLGVHTAGDSSAINARRTRDKTETKGGAKGEGKANAKRREAIGLTESPLTPSNLAEVERFPEDGDLPEPTGGRKEYKDEEGRVIKVVEWFGYKMHLLVDIDHEVVVAYRITTPNVGDNEMIEALVEQARANLPARRIHTLAYDKAADDEKVHRVLRRAKIKPLIENRSLWKEQNEKLLGKGASNLVYDEAGTVHCYDRVSDPPVRRRMAYIGHEARRGTLKYRCPARHEGWSCPSETVCNGQKSYGMTVRVKQEIDLRRFPSIPRATKQFERLYKGRTAVERVNARLKIFWGVDDGNITGPRRFHGLLGAVLVVHAGLATLLAASPRRGATIGQTRMPMFTEELNKILAAEQHEEE